MTIDVDEGEELSCTITRLLSAGYSTERAYQYARDAHRAIKMARELEQLGHVEPEQSLSALVCSLMRDGRSYNDALTEARRIVAGRSLDRRARLVLARLA